MVVAVHGLPVSRVLPSPSKHDPMLRRFPPASWSRCTDWSHEAGPRLLHLGHRSALTMISAIDRMNRARTVCFSEITSRMIGLACVAHRACSSRCTTRIMMLIAQVQDEQNSIPSTHQAGFTHIRGAFGQKVKYPRRAATRSMRIMGKVSIKVGLEPSIVWLCTSRTDCNLEQATNTQARQVRHNLRTLICKRQLTGLQYARNHHFCRSNRQQPGSITRSLQEAGSNIATAVPTQDDGGT